MKHGVGSRAGRTVVGPCSGHLSVSQPPVQAEDGRYAEGAGNVMIPNYVDMQGEPSLSGSLAMCAGVASG